MPLSLRQMQVDISPGKELIKINIYPVTDVKLGLHNPMTITEAHESISYYDKL